MTNLIRFAPNTELRRMQREFDRVFNDFFPAANGDSNSDSITWAPRVDLSETDDSYQIRADLPGLSKDDININFHDGSLTISGERRAETKEEGKNYVRVERSTGHFFRSFNIPTAIQSNKIEASYKDGVLNVVVPKAEEVKPLKVKVS